jgi:hypothetical protein
MQTDNASAVVTVTQEDREAAASCLRDWYGGRPSFDHVRDGHSDNDVHVQAFARHRLASQSARTARVEALLVERISNYAGLRDERVEAGLDENGYALAVEALERVLEDAARAALHVEGAGS